MNAPVRIDLRWNSFSEFVEQAADRSRIRWSRKNVTSDNNDDPAWRGFESFESAVDAARYGWPAGRDHLIDAMDSVRPFVAQRSDRFDVAGAYPVVPRHIAGDPCSMVLPRRGEAVSRPVLRINYIGGAGWEVPAAAMINRGAALLSLVDALESTGHSVELTVSRRSFRSGHELTGVIPVKLAGEALDLNRAAFALISPAMHRRLWFAVMEQHKELEASFGRGHGYTGTDAIDLGAGVISVVGPKESDARPAAARLAVELQFEQFLYDNTYFKRAG